jgi:ferredoxin
MPYKVTDLCILCGACSAGCESNAITEGETQAHIDVDLCVECGTCERNCPSEAIIFEEESGPIPVQNPKLTDQTVS